MTVTKRFIRHFTSTTFPDKGQKKRSSLTKFIPTNPNNNVRTNPRNSHPKFDNNFKKPSIPLPRNKKPCLLPSSLSFYSAHPAYFDTISLLNEIFKKVVPLSKMNISDDDISYILLLDIPLAIKFPSELPKNAKNKSLPNFSFIYSLNKLQGEDSSSEANLFSLRTLLSTERMGVWKSSQDMEKVLGCPLTERMYYRLCLKLALVNTIIQECPPSKSLSDFLNGWKRSSLFSTDGENAYSSLYRLRETDSLGRTFTTGIKKCAKAELWLYPMVNDSQALSIYKDPSSTWPIFVNGKPMHVYFESDLKKIAFLVSPLEITNRFNSYCVWASVSGGGLAGRAAAIRIALARALVSREPSFLPLLASIVKGDGRRVERKKYGQPKARRKFTWVKR